MMNNMGSSSSSSQILRVFFFIIVIILSLQSTHILIADASLDNSFQKLNHLIDESQEDSNYNQIQKVSGEDQIEEKETLIVQKFRALLGLKRSKPKIEFLSPAPSPSPAMETPSPAPAPAPGRIHSHFRPPLHHSYSTPAAHKILKKHKDTGRFRRILLAVLLSTSSALTVSVLGLIWVFCKFKKRKTVSVYTKTVCSRKSGSKVSLKPSIDLLYLNGLERDLEQVKQNPDTFHEREESEEKEVIVNTEFDNASSSSTKEIESLKYDSDTGGNDKVITIEESDDDESFHSFVDSHSSNLRISNASADSVSETFEIKSTNFDIPQETSGLQPKLPQSPYNFRSDSDENFAALPPPPPPPPTPPFAMGASIRSWKASSSSSFADLSSPRMSDSSSPTNQTPQHDLEKSPKTSFSIPPPQHPQSFLKGHSNSTKGPPPPPCPPPFAKGPPPPLLPSKLSAVGKDGAPLPKLKPLHWDKVRAAPDRSMVWDKIRSSSFEFDEEMMESLFGYNLQGTMKNDEAKSKTPSPTKHVLEPKRLQNLTILSKALNATPEQVCEALVRGDGLCLQQLEALAKMMPTKEEEAKLSDYRGNIDELGLAERFVKLSLTVPFAFLRVEAMLYRETFEDEVVHLRNTFSMLEEACKELRSSRLFLKLLEAVLKTGNRMNVGTIRGGARAFKLDALLKLADVKGTDGKTTLLHFVVQEMIRSEGIRVSDSIMGRINQKNKTRTTEEREEDYRRMGLELVSGLSTELYNVKKTATIDIDVLASSVSNLSDGMGKLQNLVFNDLSTDEKSGNFVHSMKTFLNYAERNLKELQEDENRVLLHVREITEYFHGNVSKEEANPLRIFVIVRDFLGMLDHVCKELRSLKVPKSPNPLAPFR